MAILAEEIVEEWLNRKGYFTIRGIKLGVHEIDLLAIKVTPGGVERRHLEVQSSMRPVSYLTKVPKDVQKRTGRASASAKTRTSQELRESVREWIEQKVRPRRQTQPHAAPLPWRVEPRARHTHSQTRGRDPRDRSSGSCGSPPRRHRERLEAQPRRPRQCRLGRLCRSRKSVGACVTVVTESTCSRGACVEVMDYWSGARS